MAQRHPRVADADAKHDARFPAWQACATSHAKRSLQWANDWKTSRFKFLHRTTLGKKAPD
eukprot:8872661-Pyramimonas_sp.AAC.1